MIKGQAKSSSGSKQRDCWVANPELQHASEQMLRKEVPARFGPMVVACLSMAIMRAGFQHDWPAEVTPVANLEELVDASDLFDC